MTAILMRTYCIACGHTLRDNSDWCHYCRTDEYVVDDYETKDRSR